MSLQPGDTIEGKYRIVRLLGEGGMGAVYEGENVRIHRRVAIKVLHAAVAAKADVVQRFEREAQAAGRIGSEHIVEVLDLGNLPDGERFMVMEFLEGESLGDRIKRRGRLPPHEVAPLLVQLLEGLGAAHAAGIIHRDLKPDNVYIVANKGAQKDFVKVLDFGVSKFNALDSEMSMTRTGAVMGTPYYMSPEQARGAKVDQRSDLYSAGVVAYQALTGRVPFNAETFNELVFKIALESPEPLELVTPGLDPIFAELVRKAMGRDPNTRYQTAQEFQASIAEWMVANGAGMDRVSGNYAMVPGAQGFSQSGNLMGRVDPNALTKSNPNVLGQSGQGLGQSGPNMLGQSGPGVLGQSGAGAPLGVSQGGLAMTPAQPRNGGKVVLVALLGVLALCGGGVAAYFVFGTSPAKPAVASTAAPTTAVTAAPTATATATAAAQPSSEPTAQPTADATVAPTAPTVAVQPKLGGPLPKGKPSGAPAAGPAPGPAPKPTGRSIGSEL